MYLINENCIFKSNHDMRQILMNILILQSGGTTPVINATLAGIITRSLKSGKNNNLYSSHNGIFGTSPNDIFKIRDDLNFVKKIINMPYFIHNWNI